MSLSLSKYQALLQLTNCVASCSVQTINVLEDGKIFCSIIETVYPERTHDSQNEGKSAVSESHLHSKDDEGKAMEQDSDMPGNNPQKVPDSVVEESSTETECGDESIAAQTLFADDTSNKCEVVVAPNQTPPHREDVISSPDKSPSIKNADEKDDNLSKRYEFIKSFIDEKYNLQSEQLISYEGCMTGNEFELAKVVLFVLSEVIQNYVRQNNSAIQTLSHLDITLQQDLHDCFNLFINERSKITEAGIKKLLSRSSNPASPVKSSYVTPKRSCSSKYKRDLSPFSSSSHDIDSPLKTYFESPIFTKKDIVTKEKEILKTRENLYEEETKSYNLQLEVKDLKKELKSKGTEINRLKAKIKEFEEREKPENCENCAILNDTLKEKEKQLRKEKKSYTEQCKTLAKDYEERIEMFEREAGANRSLADEDPCLKCKYRLKLAEAECKELEAELDDTKFILLKVEKKNEVLLKVLEEKVKECEIAKEKLSAALNETEKIPEYSIRGESIGAVIEKENEELREKIKQLELIVLSKEKAVIDTTVQCTENNLNCEVFENCTVSKNELPPNFCEKSESIMNIEENLKEIPNNVCDINKKDSSVSLSSRGPTEAVPFTPNSPSPVKNDCLGALWQQYSDSMTEDESTNEVLDKCVNSILSFLQKIETEFLKRNDKRIKITTRANGSNGLVSSPLINELKEDLKSVRKSLLCLSKVVKESDVKLRTSNAMSKSSKVISAKDCNSNIPLHPSDTCDTYVKRIEELENLHSAALLEKNNEFNVLNEQYMEKVREFENLDEQYMISISKLRQKETDIQNYKYKYKAEKIKSVENFKNLRELQIIHQKLQSDLKNARKTDYETKKAMRNERLLFKMDLEGLKKANSNLIKEKLTLLDEVESLTEKNKKLEYDVASYKTQNKEQASRIKFLEEKNSNSSHRPKSEPERSAGLETPGSRGHCAQWLPEAESHFSNEFEASCSYIPDIEGNTTASALYTRNLQNPFQLHTADEESILNHSSIAGLSGNYESEDSLSRVQDRNRRNTLFPRFESTRNLEETAPDRTEELSRRNTLCMPHLRSCYPAEGAPLRTPNGHSSNYVDFGTSEDADHVSELGTRGPAGKKRKVSEMKTEDQSSDVASTPSSKKESRKFKTPQSLQKLMKALAARRRRDSVLRPKYL